MRNHYLKDDLVNEICNVVKFITWPLPDTAKACHDAVQDILEEHGLMTRREVQVENGDGIVGRYDLVVYDPGKASKPAGKKGGKGC